MSKERSASSEVEIRPLAAADLDRVVAIDRRLMGRSRRGFYEKRLKAALEDPKGFIYVAVCENGTLMGFAMARLLEGEFGGTAPVAVLDAIGIDPDRHGRGLGRRLMAGLDDVMRHKGVRQLQSQVEWTNHGLVRFLDAAGFQLAPRCVLKRPIDEPVAF